MRRTRLLFSKTGRAQYISHLDLMRTFQRVFKRAGVALRHTEGFNPHPYLNFALPLSVGCESVCELVDFDLADDTVLDKLPSLLNATMPEGIAAVKAYVPESKFQDIVWLELEGRLDYDRGADEKTVRALASLFQSKELIITKKSKRGLVETNILPLISQITFSLENKGQINVSTVLKAQNPSLNPDYLITAMRTHIQTDAPDFAAFKRIELYNSAHEIFR